LCYETRTGQDIRHAQLPESFEQLLDPLDGVAAPGGQFALVDGAELGEDAVVEPQQGADEVVEFVALHAEFVQLVAADAEHHPRGVLLCVGEGHVAVLLEQFQGARDGPRIEALAGAEVVYVEQERRFAAVADADLQVGTDPFVDLLDLLQRRELLLETPRDAVAVVRGHEQQGIGTL